VASLLAEEHAPAKRARHAMNEVAETAPALDALIKGAVTHQLMRDPAGQVAA
jgi:hypothetical protein